MQARKIRTAAKAGALVASLALAATVQTAGGQSGNCRLQRGDVVVARTTQAVLFRSPLAGADRAILFGCAHAVGEAQGLDSGYSFRGAERLRGSVVTYASEVFISERTDELATIIHIEDLSDARRLRRRSVSQQLPGRVKIGTVVGTASLGVAWIECPGRRGSPVATRRPNCIRSGSDNYVFKLDSGMDPRKPRLLDYGPSIDPGSLHIRGNQLTWRSGGRLRRVRLS